MVISQMCDQCLNRNNKENMNTKKALSFLILFSPIWIFAQYDLLQSGPMPGYSEMREAAIWVQTKHPATVYIKYRNSKDTARIFKTESIITTKKEAFTAVLIAEMLEPGQTYFYDVFINDLKIDIQSRLLITLLFA